ncbi:MAG: nucleotidyltransferase family protein [Clostridia bacterium]
MYPIVGIICEYDPFHLGHQRHFELIRERFPTASILCVMSGCFTQRGTPALHSPALRAKAALLAGADMVLELPCAFAVRDAEHFALGGVGLLNALGFVTHLSFGTEDEPALLAPAAQLLEAPTKDFVLALKAALSSGCSFVSAQGRALSQCLVLEAAPLQKPNNILALCYQRALLRLHSPIQPLAVHRQGGYHDTALPQSGYPSATAVRAAFLSGNLADASSACGYPLAVSPVCVPTALDLVLLAKLRAMPSEGLAALPLCTEGLHNRLHACALRAATREELLALLKTKRYAYARLSRLCCHALLGVTDALLSENPLPSYARLLGFCAKNKALLAMLGQSKLPIIAKAADGDFQNPLYQLDEAAYDLWALGAGLPAGLMKRQGIVVQ